MKTALDVAGPLTREESDLLVMLYDQGWHPDRLGPAQPQQRLGAEVNNLASRLAERGLTSPYGVAYWRLTVLGRDVAIELKAGIEPLLARSEETGKRIDSLLADLGDQLAKPIGGPAEPKRPVSLAEFVAARLDERYHAANRLIGAAETYPPEDRSFIVLVALKEAYRALRIVDAQRRTLARHADCGEGFGYCGDGGHGFEYDNGGGQGCADLADLAAPDHEHPDFNPAWKADS